MQTSDRNNFWSLFKLADDNMDVPSIDSVNNFVDEKPVLVIVRELCQELGKNGINYCHWKSNAALSRSASGENDLDLLVSRADGQRFTEILSRLGFKQAIKHPKFQLPGVLNYYGYDMKEERLIHVHAHYQLVLGHDSTKNYHIPVEGPYLASSTQNGVFMVPSAEFELIILVIRLMLKHSTWDTLLLNQGRLSSSERNELDYLVKRTTETRMVEILKDHLPYIDPRLFASCFNALTTNCPIWDRARIGQKLLNCLNPFARRPKIIDSSLKLWRRIIWPIEKRVFRREEHMQMNNGGLMIAIVGGDGAGKTTAVEEVYKWLSRNFTIKRFHMGKPKWSFLTVFIRGILKIGSVFGFYPFMRAEIQYTNDTDLLIFPGYPWLIREICTARDRYLAYMNAHRIATNGALVILDRFPLPQIKFMDSPKITRMTTNKPNSKLVKYLINREESYYQKMALPDLLILLRADPDTAVRRKIDEIEEGVRARSTEIWEKDWSQSPAHVINASRSKDVVLSEVKRLIWSHL